MYPGHQSKQGETPQSGGDALNVYDSMSQQTTANPRHGNDEPMNGPENYDSQYVNWQVEAQNIGAHMMMAQNKQVDMTDAHIDISQMGMSMQESSSLQSNPQLSLPANADNITTPFVSSSHTPAKKEDISDDPMLSGFVPRYKIERGDSPMTHSTRGTSLPVYASHGYQQNSDSSFVQDGTECMSAAVIRSVKARQAGHRVVSRPKAVLKEARTYSGDSSGTKGLYGDLLDPSAIEEMFQFLFGNMPSTTEEVLSMAKPNIELEPEFLTSLGGIYRDLEDDTAAIKASLEDFQKRLNDLYEEMGKNVPGKLPEPLKALESLFWELIMKEMQDFQDLVDYEHKEKRRKFKALMLAAQKQAAKFESKKLERQLEETKQHRALCKNVANSIAIFWKKIEKFAWERLKRELQSTLVEKKRMRLDKFVEDAIKISISKNDKVRHSTKQRRLQLKDEYSQEGVTSKDSIDVDDNKLMLEGYNARAAKAGAADIQREPVNILKHETSFNAKKRTCQGLQVTDEDEFVVSEEMKQMEQDDALLERAMEKEEEQEVDPLEKKKEVNALEDDLNVPIEEILKRYKQEAEKFKEEHSSAESAESQGTYTDESEYDQEEDNDEAAMPEERVKSTQASAGDLGQALPSPDVTHSKSRESPEDVADSGDADFNINDDRFKGQEDEDRNLDDDMSDEHSDNDAGRQERVKEISALELEANIPIEELIARYRADEKSQVSGTLSPLSSVDDQNINMSSEEMDIDGETDIEDGKANDSDSADTGSSTEVDEEVKVPSLIKATLRPYQIEGLRWLASLYRKKSNGILADEMGLGKTLQTIALLAHLACDHGNWGPHLIVVPTSVLINWEMEFKKFCPGFTILSYYGTQAERSKKRAGWNKPYAFNVCIASYATVVQDAFILKRKSWVYMVLDEAQNIKNFNSKRWQTLLTFNTEGRILLTGTPLQNSLQELWSLMHFILPEIFSSHSEFKEWFSDPLTESIEREQGAGSGPIKDAQTSELVNKLHMVLRPYLLRRLKKDVEKQMPSKYEHVIKCYLSRRQRVLYDEFISSRSTVEALNNPSYRSMLFVLMQLRKICNHPDQLQSRPVASPYYDPSMMEDREIPILFVLPDRRSEAILYHHEPIEKCRDLPERLVMNPLTTESKERMPLSNSFLGLFTGSQLSVNSFLRESTNIYDHNTVNLPIVSRGFASKCVLDFGKANNDKRPLVKYLMNEVRHTMPYSPLRWWYNEEGNADADDDDADPVEEDKYSKKWSSTEGGQQSMSISSISESDVDVEDAEVTEYINRCDFDSMSSQKGENSDTCDSPYKDEPSCNYAIDDDELLETDEMVRNEEFRDKYEQLEPDELLDEDHVSTDNVELYSSVLGQQRTKEVSVNRRPLLEIDETFFLRKFTIPTRPEAKAESFKTFVQPTVDDQVERNWPLLSRFVCITGQRIDCKPRRIFTTGRGGLAWRQSQEFMLERVKSNVFRESSAEYITENKYSIEHARGIQKLLFPPRSLLHEDCGKFMVLGRLMKKLKSEGHRCLLYTQFSKMLDILENWINYMGFTYVRLDGSTKVDMRQRIVTRFNENEKIFLFISSTRAGGVGLTLTGADTVIFYDTDWNPAMDRQAMDRCHRIGQTREVNVYRLVSEHTVEENIWRKQLQKRRLDDIVVDKGKFDSEHHDWFSNVDTLMNILKSNHVDGQEEDIYGRKVLHESEAPEPLKQGQAGTSNKMINLLVEAEDEDDSTALLDRTKETETLDKEFQMDFSTDLVSTIPSLVAYCIQFMLKYKTATLMMQQEEMTIKIQAEEYDSAVESSGSSDSQENEDPEQEQEQEDDDDGDEES